MVGGEKTAIAPAFNALSNDYMSCIKNNRKCLIILKPHLILEILNNCTIILFYVFIKLLY